MPVPYTQLSKKPAKSPSAARAAGFFGFTILWRGRRYYLHRDRRFELLR